MAKPKRNTPHRSSKAAEPEPAAEPCPIKGKQRQKEKISKKGKAGRVHAYSLDDLEQELAAAGLRVKEVAADGSCFFRALSDQLHGHESSHGELRARVVRHVEEAREQYEPFVEDDEPFPKYVSRMKQDGTWAGNIELQAASWVLQSNICVYQTGQPCWTIKNFPEDAPTLHLAYRDGQHYDSVRLAGDYGTGPPQPIALGAAAADPAARKARKKGAGGAWGEEEVGRVAAGTGCGSRSRMEGALEACGGDVDQAIEMLIEMLGQEDGEEEEQGAALELELAALSRTQLNVAPEASATVAATLQQPQSLDEGSGQPPSQPRQQQGPSPPQGASTRAAAESSDACAPREAGDARESIELHLQLVSGCPDSVQVLMQPVHVPQSSSRQADGAAAAGSCRSRAGAEGVGGAVPSAAAASTAAQPAAEEQPGAGGSEGPGCDSDEEEDAGGAPFQQQQQRAGGHLAGKKGVRLKGKAAGGRTEARAPSRNKACPCGSKQKFKNCCGAKRAVAKHGAGADGAVAEGAEAAAAARQLQTLYI